MAKIEVSIILANLDITDDGPQVLLTRECVLTAVLSGIC